jgi:hypothetical protein
MKKLFFTLLVILSINFAKGQEIATTESGKKVMLFNDGTFKVISEGASQSKSNKESYNSSNSNQSVSVQCSGTTKKGLRCKRMVRSANGRCYQH